MIRIDKSKCHMNRLLPLLIFFIGLVLANRFDEDTTIALCSSDKPTQGAIRGPCRTWL